MRLVEKVTASSVINMRLDEEKKTIFFPVNENNRSSVFYRKNITQFIGFSKYKNALNLL